MLNENFALCLILGLAGLIGALLLIPTHNDLSLPPRLQEEKTAGASEQPQRFALKEVSEGPRLAECKMAQSGTLQRDTRIETPLTEEEIEAEQIARAAATRRFEALPADEKYQQRLNSLAKLIQSEPLKLEDQVALTRAPPKKRDLIEAQKTAAERQLNVNGMT